MIPRLSAFILCMLLGMASPLFKAHGAVGAYDRYREAQTLLTQGDYEEAADILETLLPGLPSLLKYQAYSNLGVCYKNLGRYYEAGKSFQSALSLCPSGAQRDKIRLNYTNLLLEMGDYRGAIAVLDSIDDPDYEPNWLISLSHAYYFIDEEPDRADGLLDSCLMLTAAGDPLRRIALQNKGFYALEAAEYLKAIDLFEKSVESVPHSDAYYQTQGNIAVARAHSGKCDVAEKQILNAMEWFEGRSELDYRIALRKAGEIFLIGRDKDAALRYFRDFYDLEKESVKGSLRSLSHVQRLNLWQKEKPLLSKVFMLENINAEFMYEAAVFRRLTSLLGISDLGRLEQILEVKPADIRKALKPGQAAVEFISYTDIDGDSVYAAIVLPAEGPARFVRLFGHSLLFEPGRVGELSIFDAIKSDEVAAKNTLYTDNELGNLIWEPVVASLPEGIVEIFFAPEEVFHFWGIENMPFAGKNGLRLHRVTSTAYITEEGSVPSREPRTLLIGGMHYGDMPEDNIVESPEHEASELLRQRVGIGDVFAYLPSTKTEVDSIAAVRPDAILWYDTGENRMKREAPQFEIIHIATHGYSLDLGIRKRPEFMADSIVYDRSLSACGLALTGANVLDGYPNLEDGVLSAREICDLDLSGVDFVILSACQTAQGDVTDEGSAGLVRGLKNAGVNTVLATLWSVSDRSTLLFMLAFHRLLEAGCSRHDAYLGAGQYLRGEKPHLTESNPLSSLPRVPARYSQPYYWAPFIIIDD